MNHFEIIKTPRPMFNKFESGLGRGEDTRVNEMRKMQKQLGSPDQIEADGTEVANNNKKDDVNTIEQALNDANRRQDTIAKINQQELEGRKKDHPTPDELLSIIEWKQITEKSKTSDIGSAKVAEKGTADNMGYA